MDEDFKEVANGLNDVASAIRDLGNGDAATPFGGLEALGMAMKEGMEGISSSISNLADSARAIAGAIENNG